MKCGEKDKVEIIRFAQSFIKQLEKDKNIELSDSDTVQVLKKVIKRNQESYDQFIKAGRDDLAAKEKKEIRIFKNCPGERTARFKYVTGTWIGLYILGWRKYD